MGNKIEEKVCQDDRWDTVKRSVRSVGRTDEREYERTDNDSDDEGTTSTAKSLDHATTAMRTSREWT